MTTRPPRRGPLPVRIELATAAFAPAFGLIALRSWGQWWAWVFLGLMIVGIGILLIGVVLVGTGNPEPYVLEEIKDSSAEAVGYIGAYIVPVVIDTSKSDLNAIVATLGLFLVFVIHVATGRVHINPLLYLVGYRIYAASTEKTSFALIARSDVADWTSSHQLVEIGSSILVEKWGRRA